MPPSESFQAATEASAEVVVEPAVAAAAASDRTVADIFDGIDWAQLSGFQSLRRRICGKRAGFFDTAIALF